MCMLVHMTTGQQFVNGTDTIHSHAFNWAEILTVVRATPSYGVIRYTVKDRYGRHGYAY